MLSVTNCKPTILGSAVTPPHLPCRREPHAKAHVRFLGEAEPRAYRANFLLPVRDLLATPTLGIPAAVAQAILGMAGDADAAIQASGANNGRPPVPPREDGRQARSRGVTIDPQESAPPCRARHEVLVDDEKFAVRDAVGVIDRNRDILAG